MKDRTRDNLLAAFAGESQARNKYTFFASVARKEGWLEIAEIFEETAKNEKEHAEVILKLLQGIGGSDDNLEIAVKGETYEYDEMYPEFARVAREEGEEEAANFFERVAEVEKLHASRFIALKEKLQHHALLIRTEAISWQCRECGYVHKGNEPPDKCPLCGHSREYYKPYFEGEG